MNVLHFGSNYLPSKGGNVVRMTSMLENNASGNNLFIMTTAPKGEFDDEKYYETTGIKIFRINTLKDAETLLPQVCRDFSIDIVVTHIIPANIIACRVLPKNILITTEVHSLIDSGSLKNFLKGLLHRFILNKRTKKYFTLSQGASEYIRKNYGVKKEDIVFLPNGYSDKDSSYKKGNPTYFTFGYVGTFYGWQGINIIADNIDKILSLGENVRIYLVGGGQREEELKAKAEQSGGRLVVTGLVPKAEVEKHMNEIDVLMIPRPSSLETETAIPLKIFDSTESGKPVIISDVFGLTEVFGEEEAFVYNKKDADGLYKACCEAYNNPELCQKKFIAAKAKLKKWPLWQEIHERQNNVFKELKK